MSLIDVGFLNLINVNKKYVLFYNTDVLFLKVSAYQLLEDYVN